MLKEEKIAPNVLREWEQRKKKVKENDDPLITIIIYLTPQLFCCDRD